MRKSLVLLTSSCAFIAFATPCYAAEAHAAPVSDRSGDDIPVLGPRVEAPPRTLITPSEGDYSLMTMILGAQAGVDYNSNIYRSSTGEESDLIATFSPKLSVKSRFEKHKFDFSIAPEAGHYFSDSKNDYLDWDTRARGRYDASPTDAIFLDARYRYDHVAIGAFEDDPTANLKDPVTYHRYELGAQWVGHKNFIHYETGAIWDAQNFQNVRREDNTLNVQDDRDRDSYSVAGKLGYEFSTPYIAYVRSAYNDRRYDNRVDSSLLYPRDSEGYELAVGISTVPSEESRLRFDAYIGYLEQDYDASQLDDVSGLDAKLNVRYQATPADLLELSLDREVKDTNTAGVSASLQTQIRGEATHQYNPAFSLSALLSYTASNYQSNMAIATLDREDDTYEAGLNARYLFSSGVTFKAGYNYSNRDSNQAFTDYDAHVIGVSLGIKY